MQAFNNTIANTTGCTFRWEGQPDEVTFTVPQLRRKLQQFEQPLFAVWDKDRIGLASSGDLRALNGKPSNLAGWLPLLSIGNFGDRSFCETYHVQAACYAGGMANAIASEEMVIKLGNSGLMGSFGSGGLSLERLQRAIDTIQSALTQGPYLFNLLHNPFDPQMEMETVKLFLKNGIHAVEAAAYVSLTPAVVLFRALGLSKGPDGQINITNHIIAKISRKEIALLFLRPAPEKILNELAAAGHISAEQAELARQVPMADDVAVEGDSGGHTDKQPLVSLLPGIIALRDQIQREQEYAVPVRVGAGGGISTPDSALGAYMMGAAFLVTGSVNQACVESGACEHTRSLLAQADMADVTMAPSADMFEMGARVQVLKKGSFFPMRAQKLYDLYTTYNSIDEIPPETCKELEEKVFRRSMDEIWQETVAFFRQRNPQQIESAEANPKKKMALIFRWYLGLASRWSRDGVEDRRLDYQIWCGPSIGAFNEWTRGTYMEDYRQRHVADVAWQLLTGCAYRCRVQSLKLQGVSFPAEVESYYPQPTE